MAKKSVAVVGTGMAGLVTAYLLKRDKQDGLEVEVFEANNQCSLDAASITVSSKDGLYTHRVDQPMRSFSQGFYPNLTAMYEYLGIKVHQERLLYSFEKMPEPVLSEAKTRTAEPRPYFIHSSHNHRIPPVRPQGCGFWKWISEAAYLGFWLAWFTLCCTFVPPKESRLVNGKVKHSESLGQYLRRIWAPAYFIESYLMPAFASVSTCTHAEMLGFPAKDIVDYKQRSVNSPHLRCSNGVAEVQRKLSQGLDVRFNSRVISIERQPSGVRIEWESSATSILPKSTGRKVFDHVILAVPPNVVGSIFAPLKAEMSRIPVAAVDSIIHTDLSNEKEQVRNISIMEIKQSSPSWMHLRSSTNMTEAIYVDPLGSVVVTNFPTTPVDPSKIVARTHFARTLRTPQSRDIVNRIFNSSTRRLPGPFADGKQSKGDQPFRNGDGNVWLVGSWCWDGMVLLEGCVVSAVRVAQELGLDVPW